MFKLFYDNLFRQLNKLGSYIQENGWNEIDQNLLQNKAKGYAALGDIDNVMNIINQLRDNNLACGNYFVSKLYYRLMKANGEADLEPVRNNFTTFIIIDVNISFNFISIEFYCGNICKMYIFHQKNIIQ